MRLAISRIRLVIVVLILGLIGVSSVAYVGAMGGGRTVTKTVEFRVSTITTVVGTSTETQTETYLVPVQPVLGVTTVTRASTTLTTSVTATVSSTAPSTLLLPMQLYWTANEANPSGFFRSLNPINSNDGLMSETVSPTTGTISLYARDGANSTEITAGFYTTVGTLHDLATSGLTIVGSGFGYNLWIGTNTWTWVPVSTGVDQMTGQGTGNIGFGPQSGSIGPSVTINGATTFEMNSGNGPSCSINQLISGTGSCANFASGSTQVAIWIGVNGGIASGQEAAISAVYLG